MSNDFQDKIEQLSICSSMSGIGACYDNVVVERFFGSLKHEGLGATSLLSERILRIKVSSYVRYYNMDRQHSFNDGMSPLIFD